MNRDVLLAIIDARDRVVELGFNPNQPRWPKGSPNGGKWIGKGAWKSSVQAHFRQAIKDVRNNEEDPVYPEQRMEWWRDLGSSVYKHAPVGSTFGEPLQQGQTSVVQVVRHPDGKEFVYKYMGEDTDEIDNELLTNRIAKVIGAPVVDVERLDADTIRMPKIEGHTLAYVESENPAAYKAALKSADAKRLTILDHITSNGDRHDGNVILTPEGRLVGIDHGRTFYGGGADSIFDLDYDNMPASQQELLDLKNKIEAQKHEIFTDSQMQYEYDQVMEMFDYFDDNTGVFMPKVDYSPPPPDPLRTDVLKPSASTLQARREAADALEKEMFALVMKGDKTPAETERAKVLLAAWLSYRNPRKPRTVGLNLAWNPFQPRWPKGTGQGGQWKGAGGISALRRMVMQDRGPNEPKLTKKQTTEYNNAVIKALGIKGSKPTPEEISTHLPDGHPSKIKPTARNKGQQVAPKKPLVIPPAPKKYPLPTKGGKPQPATPAKKPVLPPSPPLKPGQQRVERPISAPPIDYEGERERRQQEERARLIKQIEDEEERRFGHRDRSMNVSDKFENDNMTEQHLEVQKRVLANIDKVHKDGDLMVIKMTSDYIGSSNGQFERLMSDGRDMRRLDAITISPAAFHPDVTMTHEIGHFLDVRMLGKDHIGDGFHSNEDESAENQYLWNKIFSSRAWEQNIETTYSGDPRNRQYGEYLTSGHETFARAYAQWIALRSGDKAMQANIRKLAVMSSMSGFATQWSDEDFAPIARAMDALFRSRGLLKR